MNYRIIETNDGEFIPQVFYAGLWYGLRESLLYGFVLYNREEDINNECKVSSERSALSVIKAHKRKIANESLSNKRIIEVE